MSIFLDKERELRLDLTAMEKFHELTGVNIITDGFTKETLTPKNVKAFLWCGLYQDSPDLTLEDVGHLVTLANIDVVSDAIVAMTQDGESPLAESGPSASSTPTSQKKSSGR